MITIGRVSSLIGDILNKIRQGVLEKTRFCKKTKFYTIPMGFTTVTHIYHADKAHIDNVFETCTTVCKSHTICYGYLNMIYSTFYWHWTCHRNSFVATKDKSDVENITSDQLQKVFKFIANNFGAYFSYFSLPLYKSKNNTLKCFIYNNIYK